MASWVRRRDGNAADVHYLEEARAALGPIMAASSDIATSGRSHHVRALARLALAEQTDQLAAITAALTAWGQLDNRSTSIPLPDAKPDLHSRDHDRTFADHLKAHAHVSLASARAEMIAGASPTARSIAEQAIHAHDRRLAAIRLLFPPRTPRP
ncbi:MAG TPA: hypothetical protein VFN03_11605 [Trueperaceae bacterium]|nr:hypothetical protein [Trueperaceae bacterium]